MDGLTWNGSPGLSGPRNPTSWRSRRSTAWATRTGQVDQPAEYLRLTGMHGRTGRRCPSRVGNTARCCSVGGPSRNPGWCDCRALPGREPRIAVTAFVEVPGVGRLRWAGCHLDATRSDEDRWEQAGALLRSSDAIVTRRCSPADFNATPESRVLKRFLDPETGWVDTASAQAGPTSPAEAPRSRIDYLLAHPGTAWKTTRSEVLPESVASDHRPLVVTLCLTSPARSSRPG